MQQGSTADTKMVSQQPRASSRWRDSVQSVCAQLWAGKTVSGLASILVRCKAHFWKKDLCEIIIKGLDLIFARQTHPRAVAATGNDGYLNNSDNSQRRMGASIHQTACKVRVLLIRFPAQAPVAISWPTIATCSLSEVSFICGQSMDAPPICLIPSTFKKCKFEISIAKEATTPCQLLLSLVFA
jgi:hypothetical protein